VFIYHSDTWGAVGNLAKSYVSIAKVWAQVSILRAKGEVDKIIIVKMMAYMVQSAQNM